MHQDCTEKTPEHYSTENDLINWRKGYTRCMDCKCFYYKYLNAIPIKTPAECFGGN